MPFAEESSLARSRSRGHGRASLGVPPRRARPHADRPPQGRRRFGDRARRRERGADCRGPALRVSRVRGALRGERHPRPARSALHRRSPRRHDQLLARAAALRGRHRARARGAHRARGRRSADAANAWWAARGRGAWRNEERIHVSSVRRLDDALLATGFPYHRRTTTDDNLAEFTRMQGVAQAVRRAGPPSRSRLARRRELRRLLGGPAEAVGLGDRELPRRRGRWRPRPTGPATPSRRTATTAWPRTATCTRSSSPRWGPGHAAADRARSAQMSRFLTSSAFCSMNSRRGSTWSPIRTREELSASTASSMRTWSSVRRRRDPSSSPTAARGSSRPDPCSAGSAGPCGRARRRESRRARRRRRARGARPLRAARPRTGAVAEGRAASASMAPQLVELRASSGTRSRSRSPCVPPPTRVGAAIFDSRRARRPGRARTRAARMAG